MNIETRGPCRRSLSPLWRFGAVGLVALALAACTDSSTDPGGDAGATDVAPHAHGEPGETCFMCDPAKRDADRLWCREHGRYEDRCWLCHPELEDKERLYCREHFLYEDECFLCHPELKAEEGGGSSRGRDESASAPPEKTDDGVAHAHGKAGGELYCREHDMPERECGICQPQLARDLRPGESLKVRMHSTLSAGKAGIRTAAPYVSESRGSFTAFCEVRYNENRLAHITPLASGLVRRVMVEVGAVVEAGQPLVELHSAEIAAAKTAFLSAIVDHRVKEIACQREARLVEKKISAEREFLEADAACKTSALTVKTTRQKLINCGLTAEQIAEIEETQDSSATLIVRAPYAGTLVERHAVIGEAVEPGQPLFKLADLSEVWLELSVPGDRLAVISAGLAVEASFASLPGFRVDGAISWVDTAVDPRSRMIQALAVVPNGQHELKAGMFGKARILLPEAAPALRVPKSALQRFEGKPFVFVQQADDLFALRRVLLGSGTERSIDVLEGLSEGEPVVIAGTFTVMSEFLKSRLGAGCVDE